MAVIPYPRSRTGNHEKYYNFSSYKARFNMPGHESGGIDNFYHRYSHLGTFVFVTIANTEWPACIAALTMAASTL
jgi:hypothetical protein